jgi:hypothetical protein
MKAVLFIICVTFFLTGSLHANYIWFGAKDSNFETARNWDNAPSANSSNVGDLIIANASAEPLVYTHAEGSTTFKGQFMVGRDGGTHGSMTISGGTLTIKDSQFGTNIGQDATGTLTMTGGRLNLTGGKHTFVSNEANGTILLSGGIMIMDGALIIARHNTSGGGNFSGLIEITGGKLIVKGQTSFDVADDGGADGSGLKKIEFGGGDGVFMQTKSGKLSFHVPDDTRNTYVNFLTGSKGALSLFGATQAYYERLVKASRIKINGKTAKVTDFQFTTSGKQGVYSLANKKLSSTWTN